MNGIISLKPSCSMYNSRLRSNKILKQGNTTFTTRITSNKIDRILPTLSKLHIDSISPVLVSTKQLLKHPFLHHVIVPVPGSIASITLMAAVWAILRMILRRFHKHLSETVVLPLGLGSMPFEETCLGDLEASVRYPVTFLIFLRTCMVIAPTKLASLPFPLVCGVALKLSFLLFFHKLKRNAIASFVGLGIVGEKWLTVEKVSSVALFCFGGLIICEAFDVPQSIARTILIGSSFLMSYFFRGRRMRSISIK